MGNSKEKILRINSLEKRLTTISKNLQREKNPWRPNFQLKGNGPYKMERILVQRKQIKLMHEKQMEDLEVDQETKKIVSDFNFLKNKCPFCVHVKLYEEENYLQHFASLAHWVTVHESVRWYGEDVSLRKHRPYKINKDVRDRAKGFLVAMLNEAPKDKREHARIFKELCKQNSAKKKRKFEDMKIAANRGESTESEAKFLSKMYNLDTR